MKGKFGGFGLTVKVFGLIPLDFWNLLWHFREVHKGI